MFSKQHKMLSNMSSDSQLSISETMSDMFYDAEEFLLSDEEESSTEEEIEVTLEGVGQWLSASSFSEYCLLEGLRF